MPPLPAPFLKFWRDERGQDMVEYTLLLSFIVLAAVSILSGVRTQISGYWTTVTSILSSCLSQAGS